MSESRLSLDAESAAAIILRLDEERPDPSMVKAAGRWFADAVAAASYPSAALQSAPGEALREMTGLVREGGAFTDVVLQDLMSDAEISPAYRARTMSGYLSKGDLDLAVDQLDAKNKGATALFFGALIDLYTQCMGPPEMARTSTLPDAGPEGDQAQSRAPASAAPSENTDARGEEAPKMSLAEKMAAAGATPGRATPQGSEPIRRSSEPRREAQPNQAPEPVAPRPEPRVAPSISSEAGEEAEIRIGHVFTTELFPATPETGGVGLVRLPSAILPPPPPETVTAQAMVDWFSGNLVSVGSPACRAHILDDPDDGDLMEIESEIYTSPPAALETYSARKPVGDGPELGWSRRLADDIGAFGISAQSAVDAFSASLSKAMVRRDGRARLAPLHAKGATLSIHETLAVEIASALAVEAAFIQDGPRENGGPRQDPSGAASARGDLGTPFCLDRAVFLYLEGEVPLASALKRSLVELRNAQVARVAEGLAVDRLDILFEEDPGRRFGDLVEAAGAGQEQREPEPAF